MSFCSSLVELVFTTEEIRYPRYEITPGVNSFSRGRANGEWARHSPTDSHLRKWRPRRSNSSENDKSRAEGSSKRIKQKSASLYQSAPGKPEAKKGHIFCTSLYAYMRFFLILSPQCQCHQTLEIKKAFLEYREKGGDFTILWGPSWGRQTSWERIFDISSFFASLRWLIIIHIIYYFSIM